MSYLCPHCSHEQTCPCKSCQETNPTEKPWINVNEYTIKCAGCGHTASEDWWAEREIDELPPWEEISKCQR